MSFHCNIKDIVPHDQRNHVIYKINSFGSNGCYKGKTERFIITRIIEDETKETELCLNISPNVKYLKIVGGCIPFATIQ